MTTLCRLALGAGLSGLALLVLPSAAEAALAITVPATFDLGTVPSGTRTSSAQLGTVTVTASGLVAPSFAASVTATNLITGGATAAETIPKASISYWSGPATASSGAQTAVPGQLTALTATDLSVSRTAFSSTGLVLSISTSWRPTVILTIPAAAVTGSYTGTITHSVA